MPRSAPLCASPPHQGIGLAIQALHALLQASPGRASCRLVVAGGYDPRLAENVEHLQELQQLARELGLQDKVWVRGWAGGGGVWGWVGGSRVAG